MLLIRFQIGDEHYALNTDDVIEIIPVVTLRPLPGAPEFVPGIFDYRGQIVPVIDISTLTINKPSQPRLSTRIVLYNFPYKEGENPIIGLMAEYMTDTLEVDESQFQTTGITSNKSINLGPVIDYKGTLIQCIQLDRLLSKEIQNKIFTSPQSKK